MTIRLLPLLFLPLAGCAQRAAAEPPRAPASGPAAATEAARPAEGINARWVGISPEEAEKTLERDGREVYANREAVLAALGLEPGQVAADIGAGTGFFVKMMAEAVGPKGAVYGVDIAPALVAALEAWAKAHGEGRVHAVLGAPDDVRLPAAAVDLVLVSDTYHHFEDPPAVLASIRAAMKPGARLFVLDFERVPGESSKWILEHVRAGKQTFVKEIEAAGFTFVKEHDVPGLEENYLVEMRRE